MVRDRRSAARAGIDLSTWGSRAEAATAALAWAWCQGGARGLARVSVRAGASRRQRTTAHRERSTKEPADLDSGDEAVRVREGEGLTARLSVAVVRLEAQAIDVEAEARRSRVCVGLALVLVAPVLLFDDGVFQATQGSLLVLSNHSTDARLDRINRTRRRPTVQTMVKPVAMEKRGGRGRAPSGWIWGTRGGVWRG